MSEFVNINKQDDGFIKEYALSWTRRCFLPLYNQIMVIAIFIIGCMLLRFGIDSSVLYIGFFSVVVAVAVVIFTCINIRTMVKTTKDRNQLYTAKKEYRTEFTEENCIINRNDKGHILEIPLTTIIDHWESRNYYYVLFPGAVIAALSKAGFTVGSSDQFRNFIRKFPHSRGKRVILSAIVLTAVVIADLVLLTQAIQTYRVVGWLLPH